MHNTIDAVDSWPDRQADPKVHIKCKNLFLMTLSNIKSDSISFADLQAAQSSLPHPHRVF